MRIAIAIFFLLYPFSTEMINTHNINWRRNTVGCGVRLQSNKRINPSNYSKTIKKSDRFFSRKNPFNSRRNAANKHECITRTITGAIATKIVHGDIRRIPDNSIEIKNNQMRNSIRHVGDCGLDKADRSLPWMIGSIASGLDFDNSGGECITHLLAVDTIELFEGAGCAMTLANNAIGIIGTARVESSMSNSSITDDMNLADRRQDSSVTIASTAIGCNVNRDTSSISDDGGSENLNVDKRKQYECYYRIRVTRTKQMDDSWLMGHDFYEFSVWGRDIDVWPNPRDTIWYHLSGDKCVRNLAPLPIRK